jgi:hypothetical protein
MDPQRGRGLCVLRALCGSNAFHSTLAVSFEFIDVKALKLVIL